MVGFLTYGNKKFHHLDGQMRQLLAPLYKTMKDLMVFIDADAAAFNDYMVCTSPFVYLPDLVVDVGLQRNPPYRLNTSLLLGLVSRLCIWRLIMTSL